MKALAQIPEAAQPDTAAQSQMSATDMGQNYMQEAAMQIIGAAGSKKIQRQATAGNGESGFSSLGWSFGRAGYNFGQMPLYAAGVTGTKLSVSSPHDKHEQEAEQVSEKLVQAKASGPLNEVKPASSSKPGLWPSAGRPLDSSVRKFMEPQFGADFSRVRVHTHAAAALTARALWARAFTLGNDIGFAPGEYQPQTGRGQKLLAHELTHTLQPGNGVIRRSAISDDIQVVWDANPVLDTLLTRLSQADVQAAQTDADIDSKIATILAGRTNDLWLAQRIRQGQLGTTAGARPVEVHYVQGSTSRKALVIAGVHGSERQGIEVARMLLADLASNQPVYTTIIVPSLFPDNAATRSREGSTPTNRNFPPPSEDLAAATATGGGTAVDASTGRGGRRTRAILPENIMLLQLIERFAPERIISIHGTRHSGAGGVFYDPVQLTAADVARARSDARAMAFMQVPVELQGTPDGEAQLRIAEERNFHSMIVSMQHRDRAPALAAAAQIDATTTGITGREQRPMDREGETSVSAAELARRRAHSSVPGNVGASGALDTAYWSGSTPGGTSLGGYASGRGISIFTVEPPLNLETGDYPSARDSQVDAAERRVELQAYATAVRTVLLGQ